VHAHVAEPSGRRSVDIEHVDVARLAEQRQSEQDRGRLQAQHGVRVGQGEGMHAQCIPLPRRQTRDRRGIRVHPAPHPREARTGHRQPPHARLGGRDERKR